MPARWRRPPAWSPRSRRRTRQAIHLCDPIIGDTGGLFQPEAVAGAIRDRLLPLADIATPNRFELGWLTGAATDTDSSPRHAGSARARWSSPRRQPTRPAGPSRRCSPAPDRPSPLTHRWTAANAVHGTGDLFAALYLGHRLDGAAPEDAAARAASAVCTMVEAANRDGLDEMPLAAAPGGHRGARRRYHHHEINRRLINCSRRNTPKRKPR